MALRSSLEFRIMAGTGIFAGTGSKEFANSVIERDFCDRKSLLVSSGKEIPVLSDISKTMEK